MADEEKELQSQEAPAEGSRGEHGEKQRPARRTRTPKKEEAPGPHDTLEDLPGELARAVERIRAGLPGVEVRGRRDHWLEIRTEPSRWVEVATFLRDDPELRFDYLALLTGIDRLDDGFEVVVHLNAPDEQPPADPAHSGAPGGAGLPHPDGCLARGQLARAGGL